MRCRYTGDVAYRGIEQNPSTRYRDLLRRTGLVSGVLSYHLSPLEKSDVIKVVRQPRTTRYYPVTVPDKEYKILKFVRHTPVRQIMIFLLNGIYVHLTRLLTICKRLPLPCPYFSDG